MSESHATCGLTDKNPGLKGGLEFNELHILVLFYIVSHFTHMIELTLMMVPTLFQIQNPRTFQGPFKDFSIYFKDLFVHVKKVF